MHAIAKQIKSFDRFQETTVEGKDIWLTPLDPSRNSRFFHTSTAPLSEKFPGGMYLSYSPDPFISIILECFVGPWLISHCYQTALPKKTAHLLLWMATWHILMRFVSVGLSQTMGIHWSHSYFAVRSSWSLAWRHFSDLEIVWIIQPLVFFSCTGESWPPIWINGTSRLPWDYLSDGMDNQARRFRLLYKHTDLSTNEVVCAYVSQIYIYIIYKWC